VPPAIIVAAVVFVPATTPIVAAVAAAIDVAISATTTIAGVVRTSVGQKCNTFNLIFRLCCSTFLHTKIPTDKLRVARPPKKHKQPSKHNHHGGRVAHPSNGINLTNPSRLRMGGLARVFSKATVEEFC
jgi:hypothetical protein